MLQELCNKFLNAKIVEKHGFSFSWHKEYIKYLNHKRENLRTLQPLINSKAISQGIADKAAGSILRCSAALYSAAILRCKGIQIEIWLSVLLGEKWIYLPSLFSG